MSTDEFKAFVIDWDYVSEDEMVTPDSITEDTFTYKFPSSVPADLKKQKTCLKIPQNKKK